MGEVKVEMRAGESAGMANPVRLSYRTPEGPGTGAPRLRTVITNCVVFGLLAVAMFGLGTFMVYLWIEGTPKVGWFMFLLCCLLIFGLSVWLVYRMWWYIRSVGTRR